MFNDAINNNSIAISREQLISYKPLYNVGKNNHMKYEQYYF